MRSAEMNQPLLQATGLIKQYGDAVVVDRLSLIVQAGEVLGLLGPNGAGKTTTLRMLYGFVDPDAGEIRYEGRELASSRTEIKRWIGVCTQEDTLDHDFTVRRNLEVYASYFRPSPEPVTQRVDQLLERFGMTSFADHTPHQLSGGYKRRLMIARSIVHQPRVLFLDEPTTGLDPSARVDVWEIVDRLRDEGLGIVLTTHYMDEAERLSDRLLVMHRGKALATGTTEDVLGHLLGEHVVEVAARSPKADEMRAWLKRATGTAPRVVLGDIRCAVDAKTLAQFGDAFHSERFAVRAPNLDDLFLELSGSKDNS